MSSRAPALPTKPESPSSGGKLPAEVEPDCENRFRPPRTRSLGERVALRPAQHGTGGRLRRHGRFQESLRLLATDHRDREGYTDGNPDTIGDPTWTIVPVDASEPGLRSGHAIEGGAGAEVLKQFFGTDEISFEDCGARCLPAAPAAIRRRYSARSPASRRRRTRTHTPASSSGFTSANRSKQEPNTVERSATAPSISTCVLCTDLTRDRASSEARGTGRSHS